MKRLLVLLFLLVGLAMPTVAHAQGLGNPTAICSPSNPVTSQDVTVTGSGYRAGDFYTIVFAQDGAPYGAAEALADANGDISTSMTADGLSYPVGTTDVTVNNQPGSKLHVLASCSFTAT